MGYTIGNVREAQELCPLTLRDLALTYQGGRGIWTGVGGWGTREHLHVKWKVGVPDRLA